MCRLWCLHTDGILSWHTIGDVHWSVYIYKHNQSSNSDRSSWRRSDMLWERLRSSSAELKLTHTAGRSCWSLFLTSGAFSRSMRNPPTERETEAWCALREPLLHMRTKLTFAFHHLLLTCWGGTVCDPGAQNQSWVQFSNSWKLNKSSFHWCMVWTIFVNLESEGAKKTKYWENHL